MSGGLLPPGGALPSCSVPRGLLPRGDSGRPPGPSLWAAPGTGAPIAIMFALNYSISGLERSVPFAGLPLLLAAIFAVATETLTRRPPRSGLAAAAAIFAAGAVAALALALTFALDKGWLTVGLALMVPGIAWISERRLLPALRYLAAALIVMVLLRFGDQPRIL